MEITKHYNSKGYVTAIVANAYALGLKTVLYPTGPRFERIRVCDKRFGLYWEKFLFQVGELGNRHLVKDGFCAEGLLKCDDKDLQKEKEWLCDLKRDFFDEATQRGKTGCIMKVLFKKGEANQVELFDLADGVLVPVATVGSNGIVSPKEGHEKDVFIRETPIPYARVVSNIKIGPNSQ